LKLRKIYQQTPIRCCSCDKEKDGMFYHIIDNQYSCCKCLKNDHKAEAYISMIKRICK